MKHSIFDLRPTQFALGLREVEVKIKKLKKMSEKELHDYLHSHPVPVVICPDQEKHLIDHHHLVRAAWEAGIHEVVVEIKEDLSHLEGIHFWEKMNRLNFVHLFDQFGNGPHPHHHLPMDIRGLADDEYRSLAWAVREQGGFEKSEIPFAEFQWADFFRKKIQIARTEGGFEVSLKKALQMASSHESAHLPGKIRR